jgi:hypothetical protein
MIGSDDSTLENMREMIGTIVVAKSGVRKLLDELAVLRDRPFKRLFDVEGPGSFHPMKSQAFISDGRKLKLLGFSDNSR